MRGSRKEKFSGGGEIGVAAILYAGVAGVLLQGLYSET